MTRKIHTDAAPRPVGPYSQAIVSNGLVFSAGQLGIDPATGEMHGELEAQTRQVMDNLAAVLQAAGSSWHRVVRVGIYLHDMGDFKEVNAIYSEYLTEPYPARSTVQVARLPLDGRVEIDVVAETEQ